MRPILITGAAGFIGNALTQRFIAEGYHVVGIDNMNDYYDPALKEARLLNVTHPNYRFVKLDLSDWPAISELFETERFSIVIHMAAQAGVRYSIANPRAYTTSNIDGFLSILEGCRFFGVEHLIYASSSSVYGAVTQMPFSVRQNVDHPVSLYAATKKANELMAHCYSHLFGLPTTGLRFFTVYGPWGRPDMALFLFTKAMLEGKPIEVFNFGDMYRDFTFIDDIVEMVWRIAGKIARPDKEWTGDNPSPESSSAPYRIYNLGNNKPEHLGRLIDLLERELGVTAIRHDITMQPGDVLATYADIETLVQEIDYRPQVSLQTGVAKFVAWYREFYRI